MRFKTHTSAVLKVHGLSSLKSACAAFIAEARLNAQIAALGMAKRTFNHLLYISPQYSGDFVANWKVDYGTPSYRFTPQALGKSFPDEDPFKRGDTRAIEYAKQNAAWRLPNLGETIYLHNSAAHDEPYAWKVEDGTIRLRPVNEGAAYVVRRSVQFVSTRYTAIGASQITSLRRSE